MMQSVFSQQRSALWPVITVRTAQLVASHRAICHVEICEASVAVAADNSVCSEDKQQEVQL
jgi:hypothetical protein